MNGSIDTGRRATSPPLCCADVPRTLSRLYAAALLVLMGVTWKLWAAAGSFPMIPAWSGLTGIPLAVDQAVSIAAAVCAGVALFCAPCWRSWATTSVLLIVAAALNQHRCQVWAYHLAIAGLIATASAPGRAVSRLRWLTIGIYAWSAVSKLDAGFAAGPGRLLWDGLMAAAHLDPAVLPAAVNRLAPWLMPAGELITAVALAVPRWRRAGLVLSIAMHVLLLLAVGPLGLGHEWGVQVWNVLFIVQNVLLFRSRKVVASTELPVLDTSPGLCRGGRLLDRAVGTLLVMALVMPAFQPWGDWDVWPSWAVYSTRGGWTTCFVHQDDVAKLPSAAQKHVGDPPPLSDWRPIDVDAWSLAVLRCPVYPQSRFRLGVARALSQHATIRVERRTAPDRRTGESRMEVIEVTSGQLPADVERSFWLNTQPRPLAR
ncbi:MAG TPA: MauE/DoxX family redox-associated membrane protein [Caulifigura sp.]|nr:MauE/DoxX family redox-associated membrane protein [Caulifigura sp.]